MADPITALTAIGLAGTVAQFVEYALKIVCKGSEAYNSVSGVTNENLGIERVTSELRASAEKLSSSLSSCSVQQDGQSVDGEDAGLVKIAQSCEKIAVSLIDRLDTFKVEPGRLRRLRSLGQAIKAAWNRDEVEHLEATLRSYQRQLDTRIIVSLRIRFDQLSSQNAQRYEGLYQNAKDTLDALKSFESHQELVALKLQNIEDLVRLRPPSPIPLYEPPEYNAESHASPRSSLQVPQIIMPAPQDTILHIAARADDVKAIRQVLTTSQIDIDAQNQDGLTALHLTASAGNLKPTKYLCQRGACLGPEDVHGRTPLHYAAMHGHAAVVRTLLSYGAKDSKEDDDEKRAIDYAEDAFVVWMLSLGINVEAQDPKTQHTALMHFSILNYVDAVRVLIQERADIQAQDKQGLSALMFASLHGNSMVAKMLCSEGAKIEAQNSKGDTALMLAAANGRIDTVRILLEVRADVNHQNTSDGYTALIQAILNSHWDVASLLLEAGSSLEIVDKAGYHPLGLCAKHGKSLAVNWLINANAKIDAQSSGGWTALMESARFGPDSILCLLLESGACTEIRQRYGFTALHLAVVHGHISQIQALLKAGANPNNINTVGWSLLAEACYRGYVEVSKVLLAKGVYVDTRDKASYTPLHKCFFSSQYECARILLAHGAYSSPQNKDGWSPLHEAAVRGRADMAQILLDHSAKLELKDNDGYTALCRAAQNGYLNCVHLLLEHGANTSAQNKDGWTPLAEACYHGRAEMVKVLLEKRADTEISGIKWADTGDWGWTPLMRAAWQGHLEVVKLMVQAGANVHAKSTQGQTASVIAIEHEKNHVFVYLQKIMYQQKISFRT